MDAQKRTHATSTTYVAPVHESVSGSTIKVKPEGEHHAEGFKVHPIPAAVAGIGLAWLVSNMRSRAEHAQKDAAVFDPAKGGKQRYDADRFASATDVPSFGYGENSGKKEKFKEKDAKIKMQQASAMPMPAPVPSSGTEQLRTYDQPSAPKPSGDAGMQAAGKKGGEMVQNAGQKASELGEKAKFEAQRAADATSDFFHANPLAVGAMALLAGAALGMIIPATQRENKLMGEARDSLKEQATKKIGEVADKMQNVAKSAVDSAKQTAADQGFSVAST